MLSTLEIYFIWHYAGCVYLAHMWAHVASGLPLWISTLCFETQLGLFSLSLQNIVYSIQNLHTLIHVNGVFWTYGLPTPTFTLSKNTPTALCIYLVMSPLPTVTIIIFGNSKILINDPAMILTLLSLPSRYQAFWTIPLTYSFTTCVYTFNPHPWHQ